MLDSSHYSIGPPAREFVAESSQDNFQQGYFLNKERMQWNSRIFGVVGYRL